MSEEERSITEPSDKSILRSLQSKRNELMELIGELLDRHKDAMLQGASAVFRSSQDIENAVQNTCADILKKPHSICSCTNPHS